MIDSHCHFDFPEFDEDREDVWLLAQRQGVEALLMPATQPEGFDGIIGLSKNNPKFYYGLGLHPWFLTGDIEPPLVVLENRLETQIQDPQLMAIGETGLDFAIDVPFELQEKSFIRHLELAKQTSLPVIVHHRRSHNRLIQLLKQFPDVRGVIHAFSGSFHEAVTYVDMGFMLGIGGTITYERARKTKQALKRIGLEHLLLETDAPAMPLSGKQGMRNSPEYLPLIVKELATLLELESREVENATNQNFYRLFHRAF